MHTIKLSLNILTQQQISDSSHIPLEGKNTLVELQEDQGPDATLSPPDNLQQKSKFRLCLGSPGVLHTTHKSRREDDLWIM